jgi:hypothetical protein
MLKISKMMMDGNLHLEEAMQPPARHGQRQQTRNPSNTHWLQSSTKNLYLMNAL